MSTTTTPTPASQVSAGTAQVRIVTGTRRVQALVNGQWYDLLGISQALVLNDRRYAASIRFADIGVVSMNEAGPAPAGIDGSAVPPYGSQSTAPIRTVSAAPDQPSMSAPTPTTVKGSTAPSAQNAAVAAVRAIANAMTADQAAAAAAAAAAAPAAS